MHSPNKEISDVITLIFDRRNILPIVTFAEKPVNDQRPSTSRHCKKKLLKRSPWRNAGGEVNRFKKSDDDQAPVNNHGPSTNRHSKKKLLKRSPWRNAGGKVNRFKKIVDDQAKRVVRRTVFIVEDNQTVRKMTPKKGTPPKKVSNRLINKRKKDLKNLNNTYSHDVSSTLEEGEIRSDIDKSCGNTSADTVKNVENYEDDCIVIEPTLEEITIDDNDDDDFPSTSNVSTNYQTLVNSFSERDSSTPCQKRKSPTSYANDLNNRTDVDENKADTIVPFFVDVGRGTESLKFTDNFTDYVKLSTLTEKSKITPRSVSLKPIAGDGEVIDLDDTSNDIIHTTMKRESGDMDDDSVIFISETNKNDFIPIVGDNIPPHKILKICEAVPKSPANRLRTNNLFTHSETKKLNEYNENAYNPSAARQLTSGKRMVIIDGSNVAFKHGLDQEFSVKGIKIAVEYFEKMGHEVKAVIPQFRMNKTKSSNPDELERLHKSGKIVQTPCKNLPGYTSTSYDDRFILQLAFEMDAAIVSNDNYRDLLHENPAFKKIVENRVIGYTWCNDIFILPKDPYGRWGPTLNTILNRC